MFNNEIFNFLKGLDATRNFIDSLEPVLLDKIKDNIKRDAQDLRLLFLAAKKLNEMNPNDNFPLIPDELINNIQTDFGPEVRIIESEDKKGIKIEADPETKEKFSKAIKKLGELGEQKKVFYKSLLMNIISTVECFLADILHVYFREYKFEITKALISKKDKHFTMDELESFDSIEDAKYYIIDAKIEGIMRDSFEDWIIFLKEKLELKMGYLKEDHDAISEVFQRRNLFVHNNGIVNSIYLTKVAGKFSKDYKKGDSIYLDREYLESSIDRLEITFCLIAFELWKIKKKDDPRRYSLLNDLIVKYLNTGKWTLVKGLSIFLQNDAECSHVYKLFGKINYWLACKRLNEFDKVKKNVIDEDVSACTPEFHLCKEALLDNDTELFRLFPLTIDTTNLTFEQLDSWPIFDEYKNDQRYLDIKERYSITKVNDQSDCVE